ncbi:hypothetical protein HYW83_02445 [Candidatus Peregrinibacteria bacterium]|nr:hypothetical protein [Candidatus Peregrinibacteria bacterium]
MATAPSEELKPKTELDIAKEIAAAEARCDIATALRGIVKARVLMNVATPRERRVSELADFIANNNGNIRREQLAQFLDGLNEE